MSNLLPADGARKIAEEANSSQYWLPQAMHVISNEIRDHASQGLYSVNVNLYTDLGFPSGLGKTVQKRILVIAGEIEAAGYHITCTDEMDLKITWERPLNTGDKTGCKGAGWGKEHVQAAINGAIA